MRCSLVGFILAVVVASAAPLLPHHEEIAPGVHVAGFADKHKSANCGWIALKDHALLVDLPRGVDLDSFLAEVSRSAGKPAKQLVLTQVQPGDDTLVRQLLAKGVNRAFTSTQMRKTLLAGKEKFEPDAIQAVDVKTNLGDAKDAVELIPMDGTFANGGAVLFLAKQQILFAGPFVAHGPRTILMGSDTGLWLAALRRLEKLEANKVVPGFGTWGGSGFLTRQRLRLGELRRQVGYAIAQGLSPKLVRDEVHMPADFQAWMPYDNATAEDIDHIYKEMTVPNTPFSGRPPEKGDSKTHALVLIGDGPHEPGHIEEGLRPVFEATGVVAHFTVDEKALSADNLARVQLLVILRDGLQRPRTRENYIWMTKDQEQAVVKFVEGGGGFLNLHNSMGLYPDSGPYLKLVGGNYTGHGPLERFRVEVVDKEHPITKGVKDFSIPDEQHAPTYDKDKVRLILQSRSDEGKIAAAGWAYEPAKGRLCHLAPGHTREALLHPMYQLLMRNAVQWCLRKAPEAHEKK